MAELPSATVTVDDEAGAFGGGTGYCVVLGCVEQNADVTPRVYTSTKALLAQHGYSPAVDYVALHIQDTKKPVIFVGLPTATAGKVGSIDTTGIDGTAHVSATADSNGILEEVDGIVEVVTGGTVGTPGIVLSLSLDGGRTKKTVRLGSATSYKIPYVGIVLSFGAGTLVAGDVFRFRTSAPMWNGDGIAAARNALAAQMKLARSIVVAEEVPNSTFAGYVVTAVNAYETENDRFTYARIGVRDRGGPDGGTLAAMSRYRKKFAGGATLTFAEVGGTGDTITRSAGSWLDEGFAIGDTITIEGTQNNDGDYVIANLSDTVITLGTEDLEAEGPVSNVSVVGSPTLTFAEVGASGDTVTRSSGSWLDDGFRVGDTVKFSGTQSNDVTGEIVQLTATVMTFGTTDLSAETIASHLVTCEKVETWSAYVSRMDQAFSSVDNEKRIDIALGRRRRVSPITGWALRRPFHWCASIREYERRMDLHVTTWWKALGPLSGWDGEDGEGNIVEYDERVHGGALAARFTCARSWGNGPNGTFVAQSLTRAPEGSNLSMTHNMAVVNLACTIIQAETEHAVGQSLVLNDDGTATDASLSLIEQRVNKALQINLLRNANGNGPRASKAVWTAARDDILNVPNATLNGACELQLNGTIVHVNTRVRIQTGGS